MKQNGQKFSVELGLGFGLRGGQGGSTGVFSNSKSLSHPHSRKLSYLALLPFLLYFVNREIPPKHIALPIFILIM